MVFCVNSFWCETSFMVISLSERNKKKTIFAARMRIDCPKVEKIKKNNKIIIIIKPYLRQTGNSEPITICFYLSSSLRLSFLPRVFISHHPILSHSVHSCLFRCWFILRWWASSGMWCLCAIVIIDCCRHRARFVYMVHGVVFQYFWIFFMPRMILNWILGEASLEFSNSKIFSCIKMDSVEVTFTLKFNKKKTGKLRRTSGSGILLFFL